MTDTTTATTEATATATATTEATTTAQTTALTAETTAAQPARSADEQAAYDKLSDADKAKDDAARAEAAKGDKKDDKPAGAPEKYDDFKAPEGMELDTALVEQFAPVAKELNLTQDQAQKLVDLYAATAKQNSEAAQKVWADTNEKWVADARADKDFGGDKFDENIAVAKRAIDTFGNQALKDALAATGAGNHPEFIRFCVAVGKGLSEDKFVAGAPAGQKKDRATIMFGATAPENKS